MSGHRVLNTHQRIFKYPLLIDDHISVNMPMGSRVIHVARQDDQPPGMFCVWALVHPAAELRRHIFSVIGTGNSMDHAVGWEHVGTWQDGGFVWHLFRNPDVEVIP